MCLLNGSGTGQGAQDVGVGGRKRDWSDEVKELELISQISGSESFLFIQSNLRVKNKTKQNKKPSNT